MNLNLNKNSLDCCICYRQIQSPIWCVCPWSFKCNVLVLCKLEEGQILYCLNSIIFHSRYCDICGLSEKIESGLNNEGHLFLPELASGHEEKFAAKCAHIGANKYEFKRTINLPGKRELEQKVREKMQGLDGEIKKRLNKGVSFCCIFWCQLCRGGGVFWVIFRDESIVQP